MTTRAFDEDTGWGSSVAPTAEDAVSDSETPTYGQVARRDSWYDFSTNIAGVKAISVANRANGQVVAIDGQIFYQFDSDSAAAADNDLILAPDTGSGRWIKMNQPAMGGGGAVRIESLEQVLEQRHQSIQSPLFDVSVGEAFEGDAPTVEGFLIDAYTSGTTTMSIAPNPVFLRSADKNTDFSGGNYAAVTGTDAANIDTETTNKKIGSSATSFDKAAGSQVTSLVQDDLGAGNGISVAGNRSILLWINMPSVTNLATVVVRCTDEADDPTNYATFGVPKIGGRYDGTDIAAGWNLILFDLDGGGTTTKTNTGTGWSPSQLLRTFAVGVTVTSAAQTYTNISFEGPFFIPDTGATIPEYKTIFQPAQAYTVADTSNREQFIISSASSYAYGTITLASSLSNSYGGGTASVAMRSQLGWQSDNRTSFQSTSPLLGATLSSGAAGLAQDLRVDRVINEVLSNATIQTSIGWDTPLFFEVIDTPTTTSVTVTDLADYHLQLLNGDKMHIVRQYTRNGKYYWQYAGADITLTANSSYSSSVLTITASTSDITAIDTAVSAAGYGGNVILVKQGQLDAYLSCVNLGSNESFGSALTLDEFVINDIGLPYPKASAIYAHYFKLFGAETTSTAAARNRKGTLANLQVQASGAAAFSRTFKNGQFGAGAFSDTNFFKAGTTAADDPGLNPDSVGGVGGVAFSLWLYAFSTPGAANIVLDRRNNAGTAGWHLQYHTDRSLKLAYDGSAVATSAVLTLGTWNHVVGVMQDNSVSSLFVNNTKTSGSSTAISNQATNPLYIGRSVTGAGNSAADCYIADLVLWSASLGSVLLTDAEVSAMYAAGKHRILGARAGFTYRYESTSQSGQQLTVKAQLNRASSAVEPFITRVGCLQTG